MLPTKGHWISHPLFLCKNSRYISFKFSKVQNCDLEKSDICDQNVTRNVEFSIALDCGSRDFGFEIPTGDNEAVIA